jgi:ABC-type antimicrobial peptide transport system ATPase subunit
LQLIFQDPNSSLNPRKTVDQTLPEPLHVHGLYRGAQARRRRAELPHTVGLPAEAARHYPHEFSVGQRQRIGIARALAALLGPGLTNAMAAIGVSAAPIFVRLTRTVDGDLARPGDLLSGAGLQPARGDGLRDALDTRHR